MKLFDFNLPDRGLVLLGSRPGMGKTCVMLELARQNGDGCAIIFTEEKHNSAFVQCIHPEMSNIHMIADTSLSSLGNEPLSDYIKSFVEKTGAKAVLIDSITFSTILSPTAVITIMKRVAIQLGIVIIAECPINRDVELRDDKRPSVKDIQYFVPSVEGFIGIYRDNYYNATADDTIEIIYNENSKTLLSFHSLTAKAGY